MHTYSTTHFGSSTYDEMLLPPLPAQGMHLLVVLDHREARIYRMDMRDSIPQRITPYDPSDSGRYLHYVQDESNGQRRPERASFYREIARGIQGAVAILIFGHGTGGSSAMALLVTTLKRTYRDLSARVIGSIVVNGTHLSERQLLAQARAFYDVQLGRIAR